MAWKPVETNRSNNSARCPEENSDTETMKPWISNRDRTFFSSCLHGFPIKVSPCEFCLVSNLPARCISEIISG